jgi:hypothetical protein
MSALACSNVLVCKDRQPAAGQNTFLNEGPGGEKFSGTLQAVHVGKPLGHKGQQIFGRSNRLLNATKSLFSR